MLIDLTLENISQINQWHGLMEKPSEAKRTHGEDAMRDEQAIKHHCISTVRLHQNSASVRRMRVDSSNEALDLHKTQDSQNHANSRRSPCRHSSSTTMNTFSANFDSRALSQESCLTKSSPQQIIQFPKAGSDFQIHATS